MPQHLFTLPEVLAMLETIGQGPGLRGRFEKQARLVLEHRPAFTDEDNHFEVASAFGKAAHVTFKTGTVEHQMTVRKAREIAFMLLEAAEAAVGDAVFVTLLRERLGITDTERLGRILLDLREIRQGSRDTVYEQ